VLLAPLTGHLILKVSRNTHKQATQSHFVAINTFFQWACCTCLSECLLLSEWVVLGQNKLQCRTDYMLMIVKQDTDNHTIILW